MVKSPRLNFKGYRFSEALYRNLDSIKGIIAILGGINLALGIDWKTLLISVSAGLFSLIIKLAEDAVHFYFDEVEL